MGETGAGDPTDTGLESFAMYSGPESVGREKAPWSSRRSSLVAGRRSLCLAQRPARVWTSRTQGPPDHSASWEKTLNRSVLSGQWLNPVELPGERSETVCAGPPQTGYMERMVPGKV